MSYTINHEMHRGSIQHGVPSEPSNTPDPVSRPLSEGLQNNPGGFTTSPQGVERNTSVQVNQGIRTDGRPGDALKTARTKAGAPVRGSVGPEDIIEIAGVTMTVKSAQRAGLLAQDAQGNFSDVQPQAPRAATKSAKRPDVLSPQTRQYMNILANHVGADQAASLMARAAYQGAKGGEAEDIRGYLSDMSSLTGFSRDQSTELAQAVFDDISVHLVEKVGPSVGMSPEATADALEWMLDGNLPKSHVAAVFNSAMYGDSSAFKAAVKRYDLRNTKVNRKMRGEKV